MRGCGFEVGVKREMMGGGVLEVGCVAAEEGVIIVGWWSGKGFDVVFAADFFCVSDGFFAYVFFGMVGFVRGGRAGW